MMARTHRLVGGSTALVAGIGLGMPAVAVAGVSALAFIASTSPDDAERPIKIGPERKQLTLWPGLPHRKITHYPIVQIAVVASLALILISLSPLPADLVLYGAGALAVAWVMHSVADSMTVDKRGIALGWPISRRGYHLAPRGLRASVGSSSPSEIVFGIVWVAFVLCFLYARFRHSIPA